MKVTNLRITYIKFILLLFSFTISSFLWVAVPPARAGSVPCTAEQCQESEALCSNTDFCCVNPMGNCDPCFWTGSACLPGLMPPTAIPTLNQWGKIITMVVIGLFAVIGIFAMRRRSAAG